jgi:Domain of unknown function (DUF1835)/Protein of unknown function
MIHIVFQSADVNVLQQAIAMDESLQGEVMEIKDEYAVGPLDGLDTEEGYTRRLEWWRELLQFSPYTESLGSFDDRATVQSLKEKLEADETLELWIWAGQNAHDVCGYYWLMPQLRDFQGRIQILYLNNLPFINEKGNIFYPACLHEIQPKEFLKAKKLARTITPSEFEIDPDEWIRLSNDPAQVRLLEGGKKISGQEIDFYDKDILAQVTKEWQKANRVITHTLTRMKVKTGDVFLMWRVRQMIAEGKIEATGDMTKGWKDFDLKLPGAAPVAAEA